MANAKITTYELNQQGYENIDPLTDTEVAAKRNEIMLWLDNLNTIKYAGVLCRDVHDYTVFNIHNNDTQSAAQEIIELLQTRGEILELRFNRMGDMDYYECWVRTPQISDTLFYELGYEGKIERVYNNYMYILFDANDWVIDVG